MDCEAMDPDDGVPGQNERKPDGWPEFWAPQKSTDSFWFHGGKQPHKINPPKTNPRVLNKNVSYICPITTNKSKVVCLKHLAVSSGFISFLCWNNFDFLEEDIWRVSFLTYVNASNIGWLKKRLHWNFHWSPLTILSQFL